MICTQWSAGRSRANKSIAWILAKRSCRVVLKMKKKEIAMKMTVQIKLTVSPCAYFCFPLATFRVVVRIRTRSRQGSERERRNFVEQMRSDVCSRINLIDKRIARCEQTNRTFGGGISREEDRYSRVRSINKTADAPMHALRRCYLERCGSVPCRAAKLNSRKRYIGFFELQTHNRATARP